MPGFVNCPECGSDDFNRSRLRNIKEKIRHRLFNQSPYRCHECGHRDWVDIKKFKKKITSRQVMLYVFIVILACIIGQIIGSRIN